MPSIYCVLVLVLVLAIIRSNVVADVQAPGNRTALRGFSKEKPRKFIGEPIELGNYHTFDCGQLLDPILENRTRCFEESPTQVDICVVFATDYHYVIPFLVHYLSLGVHRIHLYNNDQLLSWYLHPSVVCMVQAGLVEIQPWRGAGEYNSMMADCVDKKVLGSRGLTAETARARKDLWMAIFDVDEMLVLHKHSCFNKFLDDFPAAPAVAFNWAMFLPPIQDATLRTSASSHADEMSVFGNMRGMSPDHFALIDYPRPSPDSPMVIFPHDMVISRRYESPHVKTVSRPGCVAKIYNPHFAELSPSCPQGVNPEDPEHHRLKSTYVTPWVDNHYPIAQLNHYWTTSLRDFLRKIHRGIGSDVSPEKGSFRSTDMFVEQQSAIHGNKPTRDTSFLDRYGSFYKHLKMRCPDCFRLDYILPNDNHLRGH